MVRTSGADVLTSAAVATRLLNSGLCVVLSGRSVGYRSRWWRALIAAEVVGVLGTVVRKRRYPRALVYVNAVSAVADAAVMGASGQDLAEFPALRANEVGITAACTHGLSPAGGLVTLVVSVAWTATMSVARRRGQDISAGSIIAASVDPLLTYVATSYATDAVRRYDDEAASYRAAAERRAAESAARAEAAERDRVLHDTALQTLEAVAGGWEVDPETLRRRATADAERLERLLDATTTNSDGLRASIRALAAEASEWPLSVYVTADGPDTVMDSATTSVLVDSTREVLLNVAKHSGQGSAEVAVHTDEHQTTVTVSDRGCGFDPTTTGQRLGLRHSVTGRLRDAGGTAQIVSAVGAGTTVTLSVPQI